MLQEDGEVTVCVCVPLLEALKVHDTGKIARRKAPGVKEVIREKAQERSNE